MNKESETQVPIESVFNNLNISNNSKIINHKNCYNEKFKRPWCKECVPSCIIEGWTSENHDIDEFIKDTIYDSRLRYIDTNYYPLFLEWVPYDKFEDIKQIGVGGFAKVYSATWIDGQVKYKRQDDGSWKKVNSEPIKVALKMLNGSQNMSDEYLNELKTHWKLNKSYKSLLTFYGMTKDPETKEFIMITQFAEKGNLRSFLSSYFHKDFHSGNILLIDDWSYISDFGLSGSSNEQKSDNKICGVLPYIAPEVLNGEPYTLSSDIYSFGVIMAELSSGKPPFHKRKHDATLALAICNGLRPEFGKGTPEVYKKLAYSCMNSTPNQRPTANDLSGILIFWYDCIHNESYKEREKFGYKVKDIKAMFEEANKEIPNISTSYEMDSDAAYTSRVFTFNNLSKSNNSPIVTSYSNSSEENDKDCQDSQLFDLEIS
ncbi:kinase-like domain-containing protein [Rhizophagus irregularis DAOM 181602=DAOM 197198]|uniref:Kinase-like domain-containing protein n=1 Tax=Rhizophagus irregularis (strain DAOM 181602 / DAOM 197198 / MUCL 43194) TaxID=747089 RepID=A0A2P4PDA5_RHIID|nr:kinase-like domain-containing protein [Rhizophagus irregularis DAOM 181602=DAOM 197198]POG63361.1 kinase-like domain-containing protein [Rhizophagus irregularis DAOM 181602=DAOM 197198]|eukprot:XP_025170227.1 kinase-like domain-containing protein [Rhizophagus irregularis DAOM 181602=DAOM 197198]